MRTRIMGISAVAALIGLAGCSGGGNPVTMVGGAGKAAFKAVRGAQADATAISMPGRGSLAEYRTIQAGEVTTDVPPICTPEILAKVRRGLREAMADEDVRKAFPGGGSALRMDVLCRLYKEKGTFGGEGRLDWMVTLVDAETNESVGVVFIEGVSESAIKHGAGDMAKENTLELIKFLRKHRRAD